MNKLAMEVKFLLRRAERRVLSQTDFYVLHAKIAQTVAEVADLPHPCSAFLDRTDEIREWIAGRPMKE